MSGGRPGSIGKCTCPAATIIELVVATVDRGLPVERMIMLRTLQIASVVALLSIASSFGHLVAGQGQGTSAKVKGAEAAKKDVASSDAKAPAEKSQEGTKRSYLGVAVVPLHPSFREHLPGLLEHKQGVLVAHVDDDSPAAKAGLKAHDIMLTYGDQKLFAPSQLAALVQGDHAGRQVKVAVVRAGKPQELTLTVGEHTVRMAAPQSARGAGRRAPGWASFDSLSLRKLGGDRFRVEIGYETENGSIQHRVFEGTHEQIRQDIQAQKDLPDDERKDLLQSLDFPVENWGAFPSAIFGPEGDVVWDFRDLRTF